MNYFVTGGAGFIGSNYVRMLLSDQLGQVASVKVLDKLTYAGSLENLKPVFNDPRFEFIHGDICNEETVNSNLDKTDTIVHFAAESHVDRSILGPSEFIRTNVLGTQVLLSAAIEKRVKTFLHVSTDEVYGSVSFGSSQENDPLLPSSPYSASKAASDLLVSAYVHTYGLDARITRCCNNYGANQFPEKFIPLSIKNVINGLPIPLYGDGLNIREWIHVEDHCAGIQAVINSGSRGQVYNIGSGVMISNVELAEEILRFSEISSGKIEYVKDRKGHDYRYSLNSSKIQSELNFSPSKIFETELKSLVKTAIKASGLAR